MKSIAKSIKLSLLSIALCSVFTPKVLWAQNSYPNKALHFVVGFAPGGPTDVISRILAKRFSEVLGQAVIVDNKPGADSLIATKIVSQSEPDGLSLLIASGSHSINPSLYPDSKMDPVKDFTPIGLIGDSSNFLVVNPQVPVNTVEELIAYAKKNPGKLNYASSASTIYLQTELFKSMANVDMTPIPYKGAGIALTALLGNEVQVSISSIVTLTQHVKSGKVRALAVTSAKRSALAPDVPTVTEKSLPGYVASTWYGILTAPGTPSHIVKTLNTTLNQVLLEPEVKSQLLGQGLEPITTTPEEFTKFIADDQVKWAKVVRDSHPKN
jgi:tripartite-type tricarboxylate transporter receptor subunit TctC